MKRPIIAFTLAALAVPAQADTASLFREGRFQEAADAGVREASPDALILAVRSLITIAAYRTADKVRAIALCERAASIADQALLKDPRDADAVLQKGIAIGYVAKLQRSPGLGKQARRLMDQARAAEPDNALAWAALGGWHGEAVATLGSFIAGTVLGAKKSEAIRAFEAALAKDQGGSTVPTFYAFTLLTLDADNVPRARELLALAMRATPRDGFEALQKQQAGQVLALLQKNDVAGARALAKRLQPFGTLG